MPLSTPVRPITSDHSRSRRGSAGSAMSAAYNKEVPDELMTERSLTDFTFKEKILATLRSHYK
jgi:hypothetical protein